MRAHPVAISLAMLSLAACTAQPPAASPQTYAAAAAPATAAAVAPATTASPADTSPAAPAAPAAPAEAAQEKQPDVATGTAGDAAVDKAIDDNLGDHARYRPVIEAFQAAVSAGDAAAVAALVHFPIGVEIDGKRVVLHDAKSFVARYDAFMTADIKQAIVGTRYADLFVNYKGVMFGEGQAWINGICQDNACPVYDVRVVTLQHGPSGR